MRGDAKPLLILASASPRRRELLSRLGLEFEVVAPQVEERAPAARAEWVARRLAVAKARAVAERRPDAPVLAADTVVAYRGELLGKPRDAVEAGAMLRRLAGRSHRVVTAVAVLPPRRRRPLVAHAATSVTMRRYPDDEIAASIARGDPLDKAGAYAIQDPLLRPVESYEGCYCNVVGLPLWTAAQLLRRSGVDITIELASLLPQCKACPLRLLV